MANVVKRSSLDSDPINRHFPNMAYKVWMTLFGTKPSRLIYDFAEYLEEGPDKSVNMGFRGMAKSYTTVAYCLWCLRRNPKDIVLSVSGEGNQAKGNAALAWQWLNSMDFLMHMRPRGELRRSSQAFDVQGGGGAKSENFAALSLFGSVTGRRANIIVPDDIETPNTSSSETLRAELRERYKELGGAILIDTPDQPGKVKVLGTPQTEDTIYTELALQRGYALRIWPVLYPTAEEMVHYGPWLAPLIGEALEANPALAASSTEPNRFSEEALFKPGGRMDEYGLLGFRRQFLLWTDVGGTEAKPLKLRDCPVVDIPAPAGTIPLKVPSSIHWNTIPENKCALTVDALNGDSEMFYPLSTNDYREYWLEPERVCLMVDPSGKGTDETAWCVMAELYGRIFVLEIDGRMEGFTEATMAAIAECAKKWKVPKIRIEKNFGGGMFTELLRPALMKAQVLASIEEEFATGQKEARIIDSLEGLSTSHRLVFNVETLKRDHEVRYTTIEDAKRRNYRFTYQFTRITREAGCLPHDDRVDCIASGAKMFLGSLSRRTEEAENEARAHTLEAEQLKMIEQRRQQGLSLFGYDNGSGTGVKLLGGTIIDTGGMAGSNLFRGRR